MHCTQKALDVVDATDAISSATDDEALVASLLSRSEVHFALGNFEAARMDALAALAVAPETHTEIESSSASPSSARHSSHFL
jgi:hypothetical protein